MAGLPSTRYRDLVDLVGIVRGGSVDALAQRVALSSEFERRSLASPLHFEPPDRKQWERGYAAEVRRSLLAVGRTLTEALEVVAPFLDPVLAGTAHGRWDPGAQAWTRRVE